MQKSQLSRSLTNEIKRFIDDASPSRLSRNLRSMLLSLLMLQKDGYIFNMDDLLLDLSYLFELLDIIEDEIKQTT